MALTGTTARWAGNRSKVWEQGWANLHQDSDRFVEVRLAVEGEAGSTKVVRSWAKDEPLSGGSTTAQRPGGPKLPVADLGLAAATGTYRPFLPYSELAGLLEDGPSKLYDAISGVLGLTELTDAVDRLAEARRKAEAVVKQAKKGHARLRVDVTGLDDESATKAAGLLAKRAPDLDALMALATGGAESIQQLAGLEALADLRPPDSAGGEGHRRGAGRPPGLAARGRPWLLRRRPPHPRGRRP